MIEIESILKTIPGVDDYRIVSRTKKSYETFFVHRKLETVRATDTTDTQVTVYVRHDEKIGDSTFALYESTDEETAKIFVKRAVERARLVYNQPYDLPMNETDDVCINSGFAGKDIPTVAEEIADAVFAADAYENGSLNATEIFIYESVLHVKNSRGIDKTQHKYHAAIETIPTWTDEKESVELYEFFEFTEPDMKKITEKIDRRMREVRDRKIAEKPTAMNCRVELAPHEIIALAENIAEQLNFAMVYSHMNLYKVGDNIQNDCTGDKLTLTICGEVPGSVYSSHFDEDGTTLCDRTIVKDGCASAYFGTHRFAQYLGEKATGNLRCIRLEPGTLTEEKLESAPYLSCVSLSGLQVDPYNDYIGGEIRLAYYHDGTRVIPVTGISMSGKLSEVLSGVQLSEKVVNDDCYEGPDKLLLPSMYVL